MKRLLASAAGIVVMASASSAQAPFADVPRDHWAYECVNTLAQRGLVIGYPDGTYGGKRAMTRYEFAVVICRMIPQLEEYIRTQVTQQVSPLESRITALEGRPTGTGPAPTGGATKEEVNALRRLVDEFGPELRSMRVDVDALRRDLAALTERVAVLEDEVGRVKVTGELNTIARMSATDRDSLDRGVVMTDTNGRALNQFNNLLEWSQVMYDLDLNITGRVTDKIKANAILNVGNYMGGFAGAPVVGPWAQSPFNRNIYPYGGSTKGSTAAEFNAYKAYIEAPLSVGPLGTWAVEAGKTGVQFTPYTLKLVDYDDYTNITKTDNGDVIFTGLKANVKLGGIGITAYGGTHGTALLQGSQDQYGEYPTQSGYPVLWTGGSFSPEAPFSYTRDGDLILTTAEALFPDLPYVVAPATQSAGVHASLGVPFDGTLGLTYVYAGINDTILPVGLPGIDAADVGRASVYGANVAFNLFRGIGLTAEYANSDLYARDKQFDFSSDDTVFNRKLKEAYDARLTFGVKNVALSAGYKKIHPYFGAPGAWGRIGRWKNPTNIEGFVGTVGIPLAKSLSLAGSYEQYDSIVAGVGPDPLAEDDSTEITRWTAGLKFALTSANAVDLGVENVSTKPNAIINAGGNKAEETFYNLGFSHSLSENASLKLLYQIIDYRDKGANFLFNGEDAKGSVAVGQFSVKF